MYRNALIDYEGHDYEIFWTTQVARHICQNLYAGDNIHNLDHEAISRVLQRYEQVVEFDKGRYVFLSRHEGRVYETHVYLERGSKSRPGRCIIKSCYKSNKQQYIELFK